MIIILPPQPNLHLFPPSPSHLQVMVISTGNGKAGIIQQAIEDPSCDYPIKLVQPPAAVHWFVDKDAASQLAPSTSSK